MTSTSLNKMMKRRRKPEAHTSRPVMSSMLNGNERRLLHRILPHQLKSPEKRKHLSVSECLILNVILNSLYRESCHDKQNQAQVEKVNTIIELGIVFGNFAA